MVIVYNLGIWLYGFAIRIASLFNNKAKLWIQGRKHVFEYLDKNINTSDKIIWFHVSSLGEYEQGRPVIESIKEKHPKFKILLTFFSPSGYEIRKNNSGADLVCYLPIDSKRNAKKFLMIVNPQLAFFVKYDFWYHYLNLLNKREIPTYIISAIFRKGQFFFKSYGGWYRKMLKCFSVIYVQNEESKKLLQSINIQNVVIGGDTRFDRVFQIAQTSKDLPIIEKFCNNEKVIVAGSTWEKDEEMIAEFIKTNSGLKWIIAPHEIHESHIQKIEALFPEQTLRYSEANEKNIDKYKILIINNIGLLSSLYKYARFAYIGGGFGVSIHNIQEAITYGIPVVFGPNYQKFQEAYDVISLKSGFSIANYNEFSSILSQLLSDKKFCENAGKTSLSYVNKMRGGTEKVLSILALES